jgi:hypothetical protein
VVALVVLGPSFAPLAVSSSSPAHAARTVVASSAPHATARIVRFI